MSKRGPRERFVYVLDYLKDGNPLDRHSWHRNKPLLQLIGEDHFILMEAYPYRELFQLEERVDRDSDPTSLKVDVLINYEDLTTVARDTLLRVLSKIVSEKEKFFVDFFNKADSLTLKLHALELLPNIGKKTAWSIIEERKKKPFTSFKEIEERVGLKDVKEIIVQRIIIEIKREDKYFLFVYPSETDKKTADQKYIGYLDKIKQST